MAVIPEFKIKTYETKSENYTIKHRLDDLDSVTVIQCSKGNFDTDHYMRGMANGLLLAQAIMNQPYGSKMTMINEKFQFEEN